MVEGLDSRPTSGPVRNLTPQGEGGRERPLVVIGGVPSDDPVRFPSPVSRGPVLGGTSRVERFRVRGLRGYSDRRCILSSNRIRTGLTGERLVGPVRGVRINRV